MFIVHVFIHVKPEYVEQFKVATIKNASNSVKEAGIARFDFIQQKDDPNRFVLVEVYLTEEAPAKHKETAHYLEWRDTVTDWLVEPRTRLEFDNIFPTDEGWG